MGGKSKEANQQFQEKMFHLSSNVNWIFLSHGCLKIRWIFFWATFSWLFIVSAGCQGLFYYPTDKLFFTPQMFGFPHENVYFNNSQGEKLHGWYLPSRVKPVKGTILYFHGNAHNISHFLVSVIEFPDAGYNLFTFDYQGYGLSEGSPDPEGTLADADAALEYLVKGREQDPGPVIVFGQSLGGAIALNWVGNRNPSQVAAVISESAFASYQQIAHDKMNDIGILRWFRDPFSRWFFDDRYAPQPVIHRITPTPLLIVHGTRDPIVPYHHGLQLFEAASQPKEFWSIPEGRHTPMLGRYRRRYWHPLLAYLERALNQSGGPSPVFVKGSASGPDPVLSSQLNYPPGSIKNL